MGDGWEFEDSSKKVQSVLSNTRSLGVSQMRSSKRNSQEILKFDLDLKTPKFLFTERNDIAHLDTISLSNTQATSSLEDVKRNQARQEGQDNPSCAVVENIVVKEQIRNPCAQESQSAFEENPALNTSGDISMEAETVAERFFPEVKCESSSLKGKQNFNDVCCCQQQDFTEKCPGDFHGLSKETQAYCHESVSLSKSDETNKATTYPEEHLSIESSSETINKKRMQQVLEKENPKRRISFRAIVRMKGLGRKMRKKQQITKAKREKFANNRNETQRKEFKSDSSAKYLLESSTSTSEEQTISAHVKMSRKDEQEKHCQSMDKRETLNHSKDYIFQNHEEDLSSENLCSSEYLERRRGAICEELEKSFLCGEQNLGHLRAILVVQNKLTGFGLL